MALDEPTIHDDVFEIDGFTFLVDKNLLLAAQPIVVDFVSVGFHITGHIVNSENTCCG